jgi:hypothetical protein
VKLAYNSTDATSAQTVGLVVSTSIGVNQKGLIMVNGLLDGLSILPTSTFADGDAIYLGATAGTITNVKPTAPNHLVYLGFVTTANNGSAGRMYVRVQNGYELNEIHDVSISSPTNGQTLTYNSTSGLWENQTLPKSRSFMGVLSGTAIPAGQTQYGNFNYQTFSGVELARIFVVPEACTISKMYVRMYTAQTASGSLVFTIRKNQVDQAMTVTIAAGSAASTEANSGSATATFAAGDDMTFKVVNNGTITSGTVHNTSVMVEI